MNQIKNDELRKKMANNILLVGGTSNLKNFIDELEDKIINKIAHFDNTIERVEVIDVA